MEDHVLKADEGLEERLAQRTALRQQGSCIPEQSKCEKKANFERARTLNEEKPLMHYDGQHRALLSKSLS